MGEWSTYRLADFLLFSERVYRRLHEAHNEAWWPLPVVLTVLGAIALVVLARPPSDWSRRKAWVGAVWVGLGAAWLFVAAAFLHARYAPINPIASLGAWAFGAQGIALIGLGLWSFGPSADHRFPRWHVVVGACFVAWGLFYPAGSWWRDGSLASAEWFGTSPDPTAIATIGFLVLVMRDRILAAMLAIVPVVWCGLSALTLSAMDDRQMMGEGPTSVIVACLAVLSG